MQDARLESELRSALQGSGMALLAIERPIAMPIPIQFNIADKDIGLL